jgi:NADPH2:quinone reductase
MRAVVVRRHGGPDVLELIDLPIPEPGPGQVAIDVAYAGLNFAEVLRDGETVVVEAAAGGVGSTVGQVPRALGAGELIGVVGSEAKRSAAQGFGYDHVVLRDDLIEEIPRLTGGRGVDVVFDGVGRPRRRDLLDLLAPLGRLVAYGNASGQPEPDLPSGTLRTANKAFVGFSITALKVAVPQAVRELTMRVFELVERGAVDMAVANEFALDEVRKTAHELLGGGQSTGKLVLRVGPETA